MKNPKISLIAAYTDENNLHEFLDSAARQSFADIEIICVNSGGNETAQKIVSDFAQKDERIKSLYIPDAADNPPYCAKLAGLSAASGDFICFINQEQVLPVHFVRDLYINETKNKIVEVKENYLYKRAFLESGKEIMLAVQSEVTNQLKKSSNIIDEQINAIQNEFNKFFEQNIETINNKSYEIISRFNQLEKLFYEKDYQTNQQLREKINDFSNQNGDKIKQVYEDIAKIYDYINSEINKKGCELNKIYEEISKNYHYTEHLVNEKTALAIENYSSKDNDINQQIKNLEKEMILRYVNLKRLLDMQNENAKSGGGGSLAQSVSENIEKIYSRVNETSSLFYRELSKIYGDFNEKLGKRSEEDKYLLDYQISLLRSEFDTKINALKEGFNKK